MKTPSRSLVRLGMVGVCATIAATPAIADASAPPVSTPVAIPASATLSLAVPASGAVDMAWRQGDPSPYIVQQGGQVVRAADGATTTVLDIADLIVSGGEQGLLGLAFAPDGAHAYVNYTDPSGATVIAEFAVAADGATFDASGRRELLKIEQPYPNHNGGDLAFGPDGMLYIGMGDGGAGGDPERRGQNLGELLGKMLRIDPAPSGDLGYTIPDGNPFVGTDGARGEIWSVGLRNPWRFSFDAATGDLWIADVGQNEIEEIDVAEATDGAGAGHGVNFGWSAFEGDQPFNADVDLASEHRGPIYTYDHSDGRCSVSGGTLARGAAAGPLDGFFVFADYCSGEIFALQPAPDLSAVAGDVLTLANAGQATTAVVSGPDGTVYVLTPEGAMTLTAT